MDFDLSSLRLFVRVAAVGAIGKAGAEFGFSSTNSSQRLQILESELQVKLLNRTTRAVSLTPDGEVFLEHAKRILEDVEEAQTALSYNAKLMQGTLRVTASASFGRTHIVPFVPEFLSLYPHVTLDLNLTDTVVDIVEHGIDLAFRMGELEPSSLLAQKIDDNPFLLVASPDYLERAGIPKVPEDLVQHACLLFGKATSWQLIGDDGSIHTVPVSGPVTVNLGDAVGEWVLSGLGIGMSAYWHSGPDLRAGRLVQVLPGYRQWRCGRRGG